MMGIAPVACFGLTVVGVILYQIDARTAGGFLHPSSAIMANLILWRWGIVCLIAGVFGWVLMACADAMRPPALPRGGTSTRRRTRRKRKNRPANEQPCRVATGLPSHR